MPGGDVPGGVGVDPGGSQMVRCQVVRPGRRFGGQQPGARVNVSGLQRRAGIFFNEFPCGIINKDYVFRRGGLLYPFTVAVVIVGSDYGIVHVLNLGLLILSIVGELAALGVRDDVAKRLKLQIPISSFWKSDFYIKIEDLL